MKGKPLVHFFNTYLSGGAGIAATRLFKNLESYLNGTFFYRAKIENNKVAKDPLFIRRDPYEKMGFIHKKLSSLKARPYFSDLARAMENRPNGFEQFSPSFRFLKTPYELFGALPDIIHLNWIAEWIDYPSFFSSIPDEKPIVWTLHDMNPFTAGCHYSWDCAEYRMGCTHCPQLGNNGKDSYEIKSFELKKILRNKNIHIVASSAWLKEAAEKSYLFEKARSIQTIPFGIEMTRTTRVKNKPLSEQNTIKVGLGVAEPENRRKGMEGLEELIDFTNRNATGIRYKMFGNYSEQMISLKNIELSGFLTEKYQIDNFYFDCDIFLVLSLEEAFGLTALEAMACGTPVLSFNTGGLRDLVIDGYSGWLVSRGDYKGIAGKLIHILNNQNEIIDYGKNALKLVKERFSPDLEKKAYLDLYNSIV